VTISLGAGSIPDPGTGDPGDGPTDARWIRFADGRVEVGGDSNYLSTEFSQYLSVRYANDFRLRSAVEFPLAAIPAHEVVTGATLRLTTISVNVQTLFNLGYVRHLDTTRAVGDPGSTWNWDDLGSGTILANLGPSVSSPAMNTQFDVTAAVAGDHRDGGNYTALALAEDPARGYFGLVNYNSEHSLVFGNQRPTLVVTSEAPDPLSVVLDPLGGNRYRQIFTLANPARKPLELIDLEFDPLLYDEASLRIVSDAALATDWDQFLLGSAEGVPAVYTLAARNGGVATGGYVTGFAVEFDWLGQGAPAWQNFSVYDAVSFDHLYSGVAEVQYVPAPAAGWLVAPALAGVIARARRRRPTWPRRD
jgi:hypothetical protein